MPALEAAELGIAQGASRLKMSVAWKPAGLRELDFQLEGKLCWGICLGGGGVVLVAITAAASKADLFLNLSPAG